ILIIAFVSPICKYLIEKYDEKYLGRKITLSTAYVNPFTGFIYLNNVKIMELQSDSVFLEMEGLSANFTLYKLLQKTYEISELVLKHPKGSILQNGYDHSLNFNDIIEKFKPKKTLKKTSPLHFSILSVNIHDGEFYYRENRTPINYFIKKVNIISSGVHWDADTIALRFSFLPGTGTGDAKGAFTINTKNLDYRFSTIIRKLDLGIIDQYLKDFSNYGNFSANLDADVQ